ATNAGNLARTGYSFAGWNTAADGSGTGYAEGASYTVDSHLTLYAKWAADTYTVNYDANNATSGTAPEVQTKTHGVDLILATNAGNLARTGYSFAGWNTAADGSGTGYAEGASYTVDSYLTLYAKWTADTYTVSYHANNATSGTAPEAQTKTHNVHLTIATNSGELARAGYSFAGWNTEADGSGVNYPQGAVYWLNADLTLYAKWAANTYTVNYHANNATSGSPPAAQTKTHGVDLILASNTGNLARMGDAFAGWNTAADGSGTDYAEGAAFTNDTDVTLYAAWIPAYQIGDIGPAGGIVFHDSNDYSDGWRYLEAAPASTEWVLKVWGGYGTLVGGTATAIGTGAANTQAIVGKLGEGDYAAKLCADLSYGGYSDWFLPSLYELDLMYQNLHLQGIGGFMSAHYWSSSESTAHYALNQHFFFALPSDDLKDNGHRVRAARAF
ncbi:MAG: hypothetical protein EA384_00035, partial [Spirochaetaceae bacterium]